MTLSRRAFARNVGSTALGFLGLRSVLSASSASNALIEKGYGELVRDPKRIIDLPKGFTYQIISRAGEQMSDGFLVPAKHDGMGAFAGPDGLTILIRNHEVENDPFEGAFGDRNRMLSKLDSNLVYDAGRKQAPALGGTTTLVYDTRNQRLVSHRLSLAGTMRNCAGGITPWNTWLTCEETVERKGGAYEQDHGYVFEVPATVQGAPVRPVPIKGMGRFNHEAVAVDGRTGIVYLTEDRGDGLIYRFLPNRPGKLVEGGKLQALVVCDRNSCDTRNWTRSEVRPNESIAALWLNIENVESPSDDLRSQGFSGGAACFARGEGMWSGPDGIYFACTNGGSKKKGQIWRYVPSPFEGQQQENSQPGKLELFLEPNDGHLVENADNLTMAPWGDLYVCEDGRGDQFVFGVTPQGKIFKFARNCMNGSEYAGAAFAPDGSTMFVNLQKPGYTIAITGPWRGSGSHSEL